jgi:ribosomal-protein-alanine N-acetyltransferase
MIKKSKITDVKALFTLENELFSKENFPLSLSSFYYHVKNNHLFIFKKENKIIGYILWLKRKKYYRLYSLGVSQQFRGDGVAQKLLNYSFKELKTTLYTLEVKITNTQAIKLYEKNGFKQSKVLVKYYPDDADGYLMKKSLSS